MSDLISKKTLIIQALASPGGSERSNPSIAAEVGCDGKLVRSVRAEVEADAVRAENERLHALVDQLRAEIAAHKAATPEPTTEPAAEPTIALKVVRKRKTYVEHYPLFQTEPVS